MPLQLETDLHVCIAWEAGHATDAAFQCNVETYPICGQAGWDCEARWHVLRHSFATS
jgi:hypothetical protein